MDREALGCGVADYTFGRLIAKGCHAAVYEASVSQSSGNDITHGMSYHSLLHTWSDVGMFITCICCFAHSS